MEAIATSISSPLLPRIQQNLAFSSSWKAPIGGLLQRHGQSVVVRRRKRRSGASQSRRPSFSFSIPLQCSSLPTEEESFKFCDEGSEVEIRIQLPSSIVEEPQMSAENVIVDAQDTSLAVVLRKSMSLKVLIEVPRLYGRIKPSETIWLVDEDEIVIILKKADQDLAWPGLSETWGPLTKGVPKLLKGTSVYIVGDSTDINWAVARELAAGLEYVPLQTCSLLEDLTKKSLKELLEDGEDDVADAEALILSSLNTHVRVVVSTLGGRHGAATRFEKWSKLYAGFTIWLSQSEAKDEESASEEALREKTNMKKAYAKADVVVALGGWDGNARPAAEGCLKALKYLIESEKDLPGKKSLYIRLGCRGDWPNIMPPGWNPSSTNAENSKAFPIYLFLALIFGIACCGNYFIVLPYYFEKVVLLTEGVVFSSKLIIVILYWSLFFKRPNMMISAAHELKEEGNREIKTTWRGTIYFHSHKGVYKPYICLSDVQDTIKSS